MKTVKNLISASAFKITLILFTAFLSFFSCSKPGELTPLITSYPKETAKLVSGVTGGIIPVDAKVIVHFTEDLLPQNKIPYSHQDAGKFFEFKPGMKGEVVWTSPSTIEFKPDGKLKKRVTYNGRLDLKGLLGTVGVETVSNLEPLPLDFHTSGTELLTISGDFIWPDEDNSSLLRYSGQISFSDRISKKDLEKSVKLEYRGQLISLIFNGDEQGAVFGFLSAPFTRSQGSSKLLFHLGKEPIGLSSPVTKTVLLKQGGELEVTEIKKLDDEMGLGIEVKFSDALSTIQQLSTHIEIKPVVEKTVNITGRSIYITGNFEYGKDYEIRVLPGIKSRWGTKLLKGDSQDLHLRDIKPSIKFTSDGTYLPTSSKGKLAFSTVNVKKVFITVQKVFDNNLVFFLQDAPLVVGDGNRSYRRYSINRVGESVVSKTLKIGEEKNKWLIHEIDLSTILEEDSKGLYVISLNFQKGDMLFEDPHYDRSRRHYYGDNYYNHPYGYGYMYKHARISKNLIVSDIGLTMKKAGEGYYVFATDIKTGSPLSGVKVKLYTYQNQQIDKGDTGGSGRVFFEKSKQQVFYVEASLNDQQSVLKPGEMKWNLSSFSTEGVSAESRGIRTFVYTERGVYRPGDNINLSLIARNDKGSFPKDHPVTLKFYNPRNQQVASRTIKTAVDGFYNFPLKTEYNSPTGNWRAVLQVGNKTVRRTVKVETVVPQKLKVKVSSDKEKLMPGDNSLKVTAKVNYLFGTPGKNLRTEMTGKISHYEKKFPKYHGFTFTHEGKRFASESKAIFSGQSGIEGKAEALWQLPVLEEIPCAASALVSAKVFEKGGRFTTAVKRIPVEIYREYTGIEKMETEYGYLQVGDKYQARIILVNNQGESQMGRELFYRVYRNRRYWWWEYNNGRDWKLKFKSHKATELVDDGSLFSQGIPAKLEFPVEERGEYLLEVQNGLGGHTTAVFFRASFWGGGGKSDDAAVLSLRSDKKKYQVGETALVSFPSPTKGRALVSIEKGDKVIKTFWSRISSKNKNTSLKIKITKDMIPNAYVSISLIQPYEYSGNDRPLRTYGILPLEVESSSASQELLIETEESLKPGEEFEVTVRTRSKRKTQLTLSVVDEGLLSLTRYKTPNPYQEFFRKQRLSVETCDLYSGIIASHTGDVFKLFSIGGGMEMMAAERTLLKMKKNPLQAKRFKPVALFKGPLVTDSEGKVKVKFKMPDYIGAVRIMAVSAEKMSFGSSELTVPVKQDLIVMPTLPRVIGPAEEFILPVSVFAMSSNIGKVDVKIEVKGPLDIEGDSIKKLEFASISEEDLKYKLRSKGEMGIAKIKITAASAAHKAFYERELAVRPSSPRIYKTSKFKLEKGKTIKVKIPGGALAGSMESALVVNRLPRLNLTHRLQYLIRYPYGCIEQTTSAAFPQLYLKAFIRKVIKQERNIDQNINGGIERLKTFLLPSGAFSYWPGNRNISHWGNNYAGHFLLEAKKLGYHVPSAMLSGWLKYQISQSLKSRDALISRLYRNYLLALAGKSQKSAINILKEDHFKSMRTAEKWLLAGTYKLAGDEKTASSITGSLGTEVTEYRENGGSYGSTLRDKAIILDMMVLFGMKKKGEIIYNEIAEEIAGQSWCSTQELSWSLMAMGKYLKMIDINFEEKQPLMSGEIVTAGGKKFPFSTADYSFKQEFSDSFGKEVSITLTSSGSQFVYVNYDWSGLPLFASATSDFKNISMTLRWLDESGFTFDPSRVKQGDTFFGEINIRGGNSRGSKIDEVALVQILPSGWEIENTRLTGDESGGRGYNQNKFWEYLDIRDDRLMWFFDMYSGRDYTVRFKVNAITAGSFQLPPTQAEAMYDHNYRATIAGKKVEVYGE